MEDINKIIDSIEQRRPIGVDGVMSRINGTTGRIIEDALSGKEISVEDGIHLFSIDDTDEISALALAADQIRKEDVGDVVTYVVNRNINFTNICDVYCGFCNFMADEGDERAYFLSMDEVAERTVEAWEIGATEVCMQGGMHPEIDGNFYVELIKTVKKAVPEMHTHAFSPYEIYYGAKTLGIEEEEFIRKLKDVGHNTFPGTAAEVLVEEVRKVIAPRKIPTEVWIRVVKKAHKEGMRTHFDHNVRAPRQAPSLGNTPWNSERHTERNWRIHGIRAAPLYSMEHKAVHSLQGKGEKGSDRS